MARRRKVWQWGWRGEQIQEEGCAQPDHHRGMEWLGKHSTGPSVTPGSGLRCRLIVGSLLRLCLWERSRYRGINMHPGLFNF